MNKLKAHLDNIALSHSVFALPFAYMGAILAAPGWPDGRVLVWITVAMVGARSAALALNNLVDLKYDRLQPRFANRPLVTGAVKPWEAKVLILASLGLFFTAAARLNTFCLQLALPALIPLIIYPYMKRFSWTCHLVLGLALALAPVGAWAAVRAELAWPALLLGGAVGVWIAGFDVIYACQDVDFDRRHGLHSLPARWGVENALQLAKVMHVLSIAGFGAVGYLTGGGPLYYLGVGLAGLVLIYQHAVVDPGRLTLVNQRYFMRNGMVGIAMFIFTALSMLFN